MSSPSQPYQAPARPPLDSTDLPPRGTILYDPATPGDDPGGPGLAPGAYSIVSAPSKSPAPTWPYLLMGGCAGVLILWFLKERRQGTI